MAATQILTQCITPDSPYIVKPTLFVGQSNLRKFVSTAISCYIFLLLSIYRPKQDIICLLIVMTMTM